MNIVDQLVETGDSQKLSTLMSFDKDLTFRMLKGIQINDGLWLSVQASYGHYCSPRQTLKDLNEYNSMEFALRDREGNFLSVADVLPNFSRLEEIEEYHDTVYGYVPVNLINDLYNELIS